MSRQSGGFSKFRAAVFHTHASQRHNFFSHGSAFAVLRAGIQYGGIDERMSGPKLMELRRLRRAALRKHNLEKMAELKARYARLFREVAEWRARLAEVGIDVPQQLESLAAIERKYAPLLDGQKDVEVVREFSSIVESLGEFTDGLRLRHEEKLAEIDNRVAQLHRDHDTLEWMGAERNSLPPRFSFSGSLSELERAEMEVAGLKKRLSQPKAASPDKPDNLPGPARGKVKTISDLIKEKAKSEKPAAPAGFDDLQRQIQNAARALSRYDRAAAEEMRAAARAAGELKDPVRSRLSLENILLGVPAALARAKDRSVRLEEINVLIDSAAAFSSPAVLEIVRQLRDEAGSTAAGSNFVKLKESLARSIAEEQAAQEREEKRRALLDSLKELGYETNEQLETALVREGRLVFSSPRHADYALEVVANQDLSQVQTALVRFTGEPTLTEEQRRRDIEHEEQWCGDHLQLRRRIAERGFEVNLRAQQKPGEHPIKILPLPTEQRRQPGAQRPQLRSK